MSGKLITLTFRIKGIVLQNKRYGLIGRFHNNDYVPPFLAFDFTIRA